MKVKGKKIGKKLIKKKKEVKREEYKVIILFK